MLYSLYTSFLDIDLKRPERGTPFVGLANYAILLSDPQVYSSFGYTILYTFSVSFGALALGLGLALLLNRDFRGKMIIVPLFLLPYMAPMVVTGLMWRLLFNVYYGHINYYLTILHIVPEMGSVLWLGTPMLAIMTTVIANCWQWIPFNMLILLAGLTSLPQELYESAQIDGASRVQCFRRITVPLLKPLILIVTLFTSIINFRVFDVIFLLTRGGPGISTTALSLLVYRNTFDFFKVGYGTAMSWIIAAVTFVITVIYFRLLAKR